MPTKTIFLASSEELKQDRYEFEVMIARLNQQWRARDYVFDLVVWENFIDAMSPEGLQEQYNKAVTDSDIFVMLFFTKVGLYTKQEFEVAFREMKTGTGPRIYTYFRNDHILTGRIDESIKSLLDFKLLLKQKKHYVTMYSNSDDLKFQFSQQLEKLYGEAGVEAQTIDDDTSPVRAGEIALLMSYRHLYGNVRADPQRLYAAMERAGRPVRETLYQMASELRREHWSADKRQMERCIPVLEALTKCHPDWHASWGQLGYALVDRVVPDWKRAKECLDRAVELRGDHNHEGYFYNYNRLRCAVQLDPKFAAQPREPADTPTRESIRALLDLARRDLSGMHDWDEVLKWASSESLREWAALNPATRKRG